MKIKVPVSILLAFLVFIFITQNTVVVQVKFLVWSMEVSLVLLVFVKLFVGMVIGWLLNSYLRFLRTRKRSLAENPPTEKTAVPDDIEKAAMEEGISSAEEEKQKA